MELIDIAGQYPDVISKGSPDPNALLASAAKKGAIGTAAAGGVVAGGIAAKRALSRRAAERAMKNKEARKRAAQVAGGTGAVGLLAGYGAGRAR